MDIFKKIDFPQLKLLFNKRNSFDELPLRTNFSWTFLGNVTYAACQWGILAVIAKFTNPETLGIFALGLAITAPIIIFSNLALRAVQATDARGEYRFNDYFGLRLISTSVALLVIILITITIDYSSETRFIIILIGIAKAIEAISDVIYGFFQKLERMDRSAISMIIKGPISFILVFCGIFFTKELVNGLFGWITALIIVLLFYDIPITVSANLNYIGSYLKQLSNSLKNLHIIKPTKDLSILKGLFILSLPLGITALLIALDTNIPRYFIERFLGPSELGIFVAMAYFIVVGRVLIGALGKSASPRLAKYYAKTDWKGFQSLLLRLVLLGGLMGILGIVVSSMAGEEILTFLYTVEYANNSDILVLLMTAGFLTYIHSFLGIGMTAARKFRIQPILIALSNTILIVACILLIPIFGLRGASMALVLSASFQLVSFSIVIILAIKILRNPPNKLD